MDSTMMDTPARITDATLRALARRGLRKLSVTDICDEAGIARGTLYRYFASREAVLEAVEARVVEGVSQALRDAVRARPDADVRLQVVLDGLAAYRAAHPEVVELLQDEPVWVRGVLARVFEDLLDALQEALRPTLARAACVVEGAMSERRLAEVLLRLILTRRTVAAAGVEDDEGLWAALLTPARPAWGDALPRAS